MANKKNLIYIIVETDENSRDEVNVVQQSFTDYDRAFRHAETLANKYAAKTKLKCGISADGDEGKVIVSVLGMDHISLFALLMAVSMFFYSKISMQGQTAANDPNAKMMQSMSLYIMPVMMFFICNNLSSGLSYYYLLSNIITFAETYVIRKWCVNPEEIVAKVKAAENKPAPKSKWQQRLEEAQKMQREMQKNQKKH